MATPLTGLAAQLQKLVAAHQVAPLTPQTAQMYGLDPSMIGAINGGVSPAALPAAAPQPSATAGGQVRPVSATPALLQDTPMSISPADLSKYANVWHDFGMSDGHLVLKNDATGKTIVTNPSLPNMGLPAGSQMYTTHNDGNYYNSQKFIDANPNTSTSLGSLLKSPVFGLANLALGGGLAAAGAFGGLAAGAGEGAELAGAASDAGLATAANASAQGAAALPAAAAPAAALPAALPEAAAPAAEALPGAASDAGLPTAANASAQGLPAAAAPASLPNLPPTPSTPPAASPAEVAPGPPAGTAPAAPTAPVTPVTPVTPTPTGGAGLPDPPTLGQAATAASAAASAKTLLGGSGVSDEQLLTGQAPEAGGNQAGDVQTGFSGQGAGPDGSGVPTGLPAVNAPGSGLPGLPDNAGDLLKLAPAIGGLAGLATSSSNANKYFDEIKALGGPQRDIANQLLAQYKSGTLNAADQFKIDQTKQAAINRANDFYAKAGIPDSTQLQGTLHDIDVQANAQTEQARQNLLTQGLNELNLTDQTQVEAIKAQIAGDQAAAKAMQDFMSMLGQLGTRLSLPATQSGVATTK